MHMTLLNEAVNSKKLDTRMIERNVARGVITSKEVDAHLAQLPDDAERAEWVSDESFSDADVQDEIESTT
jgi:hypothetical protein